VAGAATCVGCGAGGADIVTPFSQTTILNTSKNKAGWTLVGGIEAAAFAPNWTWKAEYLYLDFGKFDHSFATAGGGLITTNTRATDHILRFGVNKGPVVASW
jgi:outer membrane immunogenic protein